MPARAAHSLVVAQGGGGDDGDDAVHCTHEGAVAKHPGTQAAPPLGHGAPEPGALPAGTVPPGGGGGEGFGFRCILRLA